MIFIINMDLMKLQEIFNKTILEMVEIKVIEIDADVQDGSGINNANFATPADGGNGRMQMFLWDQGAYNPNAVPLLVINNTVIAGDYPALDNNFDAPGHVPFVAH